MSVSILTVGMINCDVPLFPVPPRLQETEVTRVAPPIFSIGGDAANVAITLAKLGLEVSIVGRVGQDENGRRALGELERNGVDVSGVLISPQDVTSTSFHLLQESGEHNFIFYSTTVDSLCAEDVPDEFVRDAQIVYFGSALTFPQMDRGGIQRLFRRAHEHGAVTAMDAALAGSKVDGETAFRQLEGAFRETDIFFPSLLEMEYLTGVSDPHEIACRFRDSGIKILGIKLGRRGSYVTDFREEHFFSSYPDFKAVDTVGAGDSFMGGLIASVLQKGDILRNVSYASAVAGFNIEHIGATAGVPEAAVVESFIRRNKLRVESRDFLSGK